MPDVSNTIYEPTVTVRTKLDLQKHNMVQTAPMNLRQQRVKTNAQTNVTRKEKDQKLVG
jgi:hypothetical protein